MIIILFLSLFIFFNFQSSPIQTIQAASGTFTEDFTTTTHMDAVNTNVSGWGTGSIENSRRKPTIIGSISSGLIGDALSVFVDGDYAYVTDKDEGLKVVNITDPTNPHKIGSYDTPNIAQSIYVDGDYVFIADGSGDAFLRNVIVLDVTDPSNPTLLGNCTTAASGSATGIYVSGDTAYVACTVGGVYAVDVTDPSAPQSIGNVNTAGEAYSVVIDGDYAYVADGTNGLVVVDIIDPTNLNIVATFSTGISSATNIVIEGNYAYVIDINNGMIVVNITDPTTPSFVESWSKSGASDAFAYGNYLYVTDITDGLSVVNITDPNTPKFINTISLPGLAQAIVIEGCYAYIACYDGGFQVAELSNASPPNLIGTYDTPSFAQDVFVSGNYAYVADYSSGLQILDITDPSAPTLTGFYDTPGEANDVFVSGDYAYVADHYSGLQILNISNPSAPTFVGSYNTPDRAFGVFVSGDYAYVADGISGVLIFDISDPSTPTLTGSYNDVSASVEIIVSGNYAYVADDFRGMQILNISNPSAPTFVGSYNTPDQAYGIFISGDYAYIADLLSGVLIFDISDPSTPSFVGSYNTPDRAFGVFVSGDFAYVSVASSGVIILDVSDPSTPTLAGSYDTPGSALGIYVSGDYAFVADNDYGLQVIEVRKNKARQFDSPCIARTSVIPTGSGSYSLMNAILTVTDNKPSSTTLTYYLSADNGNNWESITPGTKHVFVYSGNQLKWKAVLTTTNISVTPEVFDVSIVYETVLDSPSLQYPLDGAITDDYTPSFLWNTISGATEYLFQLDTSSSFTAPIINVTIPSSSVTYSVATSLAIDTYYWRVAAIDSDGDLGTFANYRTFYIIQDTNSPVINQPNDISYELGTTGNSITWIPTDTNPSWYNITLNGILTSHDDPWTGGSIVMNIDGLPLGTYTVICSVYDLEGLMISDTINVEVVSTAPPTIDDIADFDYEESTIGNSITWHPTDTNPDWHAITRDGTIIDEGIWTGGDLTINIDGLAYGVYTYVCTVNDTEGQEASDTVIVTISDNTIPILSSPADIIYTEGETGNNIIWVATDTNPETFIVYKDGALYETNTWTSGSSIIISVDGLSAGQYNFTIVVVDQAGNSAKDTVIVAVTASVPEFSQSIFLTIISIALVFVFYYIKRRTLKKR
jgi:hypothetical protein